MPSAMSPARRQTALVRNSLPIPTVTVYMSDALGNAVADSPGNNPGLFTNAGVGHTSVSN